MLTVLQLSNAPKAAACVTELRACYAASGKVLHGWLKRKPVAVGLWIQMGQAGTWKLLMAEEASKAH